MKKIKTRFVYDEDGKKRGIVIDVKDFERLIEGLEDLYDYRLLEKFDSRKALKEGISLEEYEKKYLRK